MMQSTPAASTRSPGEWGKLGRAALVVLGIEVGLLLLALPWSPLWDHNPLFRTAFAAHPGMLHAWLSGYTRGAVTGLGLLNLWNAASEIAPFRP